MDYASTEAIYSSLGEHGRLFETLTQGNLLLEFVNTMKHPTEKIYRGAVIGIGRMGSKIDDEQKYFYFPYPWSHGGAMVESKRVELVAGSDLLGEQREDFRNRWGIDAVYEDFREMLAKEDIEFVSITTKHEERADVIMACAEAKVEIIYPTKPFCNTLVEGDTVIRACREAGSLLAVSCHQNWNPWFHACRKSIEHGDIGKITAIISQNNLNDHNAALMRMFAGASPKWVMADFDGEGPAGIIGFENCVRGFDTPGAWQYLQIIGTDGWIDVRDEYREFELWRRFPGGFPPEMVEGFQTFGGGVRGGPPARMLFPNPRIPMSSQLASIDALVRDYENGTTPECPGEWGLEAMEMYIGAAESAGQGGRKLEIPLADRSLAVESSGYWKSTTR